MRVCLLPIVALAAIVVPAHSQPVCDAVKDQLQQLAAARSATPPDAARIRTLAVQVTDLDTKAACLVAAYNDVHPPNIQQDLVNALADAIQNQESSRNDKQTGAASGAAGSTSAVSAGATAKVLSFATEYGALTQSVNKQTVTVNGNLAGLPTALIENGLLYYCLPGSPSVAKCINQGALGFLQRFSFGVSFDTSRDSTVTATPTAGSTPAGTTATPVTFTGQQKEISQVTGRIELWDKRDYTSQNFARQWQAKVGAALASPAHVLLEAAKTLVLGVLEKYPGYRGWRSETADALAAAPTADLEAVWTHHLVQLIGELDAFSPGFGTAVTHAYHAYSSFFLQQQQLLDDLAKGAVIALEYTDDRPVGKAPTSTFRLIVDLPFAVKWRLNANGAFTIYDSVPAGAQPQVKRFRDAQAAAELSYSLGKNAITGPAAVSLAGYYQDQRSAALLNVDPSKPIDGITFVGLPPNAKTILAQTGNIELVQLKLSVTPKGAGVKVPLAVSYSNRTDLINKPSWRAQVGLTYNFDGLFTK